jgi:hypothetical protein
VENRRWGYAAVAEAEARGGDVGSVKGWVETLKDPEDIVHVCLGAVKGLQGDKEESGE